MSGAVTGPFLTSHYTTLLLPKRSWTSNVVLLVAEVVGNIVFIMRSEK